MTRRIFEEKKTDGVSSATYLTEVSSKRYFFLLSLYYPIPNYRLHPPSYSCCRKCLHDDPQSSLTAWVGLAIWKRRPCPACCDGTSLWRFGTTPANILGFKIILRIWVNKAAYISSIIHRLRPNSIMNIPVSEAPNK